jgi:hypothetical protein
MEQVEGLLYFCPGNLLLPGNYVPALCAVLQASNVFIPSSHRVSTELSECCLSVFAV